MVLTTKDFAGQPEEEGVPVQTANGPFEGDPDVIYPQDPDLDYSLVTVEGSEALTASSEVPA